MRGSWKPSRMILSSSFLRLVFFPDRDARLAYYLNGYNALVFGGTIAPETDRSDIVSIFIPEASTQRPVVAR